MVDEIFNGEARLGANINHVLLQELPKPAIKMFKRRKVCAKFKWNILAVDLAEIGS